MVDKNSNDESLDEERTLERRELFTTTVPVLVNHLNYGNHLGYDSVLSILQEARMRWLKSNNMTELGLSGSVGYMITHASVDYHGEGFYGDKLQVRVLAAPPSRRGFELYYHVTNETSGKVIAEAKTKHIFFDFGTRKLASGPESFAALFESGDDLKLPPV
jgi:acyl-CoA thioester hydrolase